MVRHILSVLIFQAQNARPTSQKNNGKIIYISMAWILKHFKRSWECRFPFLCKFYLEWEYEGSGGKKKEGRFSVLYTRIFFPTSSMPIIFSSSLAFVQSACHLSTTKIASCARWEQSEHTKMLSTCCIRHCGSPQSHHLSFGYTWLPGIPWWLTTQVFANTTAAKMPRDWLAKLSHPTTYQSPV